MKNLRLLLLFLVLLAGTGRLRAAETNDTWTIESLDKGDFDYDLKTGVASGTNGVSVTYGATVLTARRVTLNRNTGDIVAEGDVMMRREGQLWRSERLSYNFKTHVLGGADFKSGQRPYFYSGHGLITDPTNNIYTATNSFFTTDDNSAPGHRIRASKLVIVPGKYIEARDAVLYFGKVPVFYWPWLHKSLQLHDNFFVFEPGYESRFGPYLRSRYHWTWNDYLEGALNLDLYQKRGIGFGPDFNWHSPALGEGRFRYYFIDDNEPGQDPFGRPVPRIRQRIEFSENATLDTNFTLKALFRYQTDNRVVRDYYESEHRANVQPSSFVELNKQWANWNLNLLAQPQINSFQETIERLPDVKLTGLSQQLGPTPLYYQSESSVGYFRHVFPDLTTNSFYPVRTNAYSATRADTYHQITLPWTFFGWLNVAPRAGGRFSYYGASTVNGTPAAEQTRGVFNTGADVSFKASRVWRDVESGLWDVKGLRHIIEPSVNYVFVPTPNVRPMQLPAFDSELPSYRLLPIDYPDYNAIDSIDSQNVLRLGLRNKLQTRRADGMDNLLNWAIFTDWRLDPRPGQNNFSDIYSDIDFKPRSWLTLSSETRFDIAQGKFSQANHTILLEPANNWSISLGHRYRVDSPEFGTGNNLILSSLYVRFNENWGARIAHHYEARDGRMEEQFYTIYRDLRSWTGALTFRVRDNRTGPTDYTIALSFTLKAFPRLGIDGDHNQATSLFGG